ncbi:hypothetical protein BGZ52_005835, partial [Haplosporangium bisporale]
MATLVPQNIRLKYSEEIEHIKDFLQTYKAVLSETDVEDTAMEIDNHGLPQLKYFKQLQMIANRRQKKLT